MRFQKTQLFFVPKRLTSGDDRGTCGPRAACAEPSCEIVAACAAPTPPAQRTHDAAHRGSRILRLADVRADLAASGRVASAPIAADMLPDPSRFGPLAQTRFLPIEQLLEAPAGATVAGTGAKPPPLPRRAGARAAGGALRRLRVAAAVALLTILGVATMWLAEMRVPSPSGPPSSSRAAQGAEPAGATADGDELVAPPVAQREAPTVEIDAPPQIAPGQATRAGDENASRVDDPLARKAADALANGDFARARRTYEALAQRQPTQPAYAEAARILRQRLARAPSRTRSAPGDTSR